MGFACFGVFRGVALFLVFSGFICYGIGNFGVFGFYVVVLGILGILGWV